MNFTSILAVSDFTAQSAHVLERAALLARQHQMALRLVHLAEGPCAFLADPIARMGLRARQLARRHDIPVTAVAHSAPLEGVLTEASASTLLVLGPLSRCSWTRFYRGTLLDQAVHRSVCPLLVVKQAALKPYERVLVAIDLSPDSKSLIAFAGRLSNAAVLKLFHATETVGDATLRSFSVSPEAIQANRFGSRLKARDRLAQLMGAPEMLPLGLQKRALVLEVGNGDPAYLTAQHQRFTQTELVAVGRRRRSPLLYLTGSVAQRLAKWAEGDVLIAPFDHACPATGATH